MDIFAYLLLQIINGNSWQPKFSESSKYKNWIAVLDPKTCLYCRKTHGEIWHINEVVEKEPPVHERCRCVIRKVVTVEAGPATIQKTDGADWQLKHNGGLPDSYIEYDDAINSGWKPILGNLANKCPGKQITNGQYKNRNGHLPQKENRIWYEADINYKSGYRNNQRIVFSNDGLIFVTFDHYQTFFEIV